MFSWEEVQKNYNLLIKNNQKNNIIKIFCLDCVETSLEWLDTQKKVNKEIKLEMASIVYNYYLDTSIQISEISDIVCENWEEIQKNENFNIYDYVSL